MIKQNQCPICKSVQIIYLPCKGDYDFCQNCLTAFKKNVSISHYAKEYYLGCSKNASKIFSILNNYFYSRRRRFIARQPKLWIDVGAGDGNFLETVFSKKKLGVEISSSGRLFMKERVIDCMTPNQFIKSKQLKADVISFWHSLEHLDNPKQYIVASYKNLTNNGKLIIGVPNIDSLEFSFFKNSWFHLAPKYHMWHFSPTSITYLLKDCGFLVKKVDYYSFEHHFAGLLQSVINLTSENSDVLHKLFKRRSGLSEFSLRDKLWCLFWLTLGLPILIFFFFFAVLTKRSGTIVVVAEKNL